MYEGKKVAIAGFAMEGQSALPYFLKLGAEVVVLDEDEKKAEFVPEGIEFRVGPDAFSNFEEFDLVSRTAGIRLDRLVGAKEITSMPKEFFKACQVPIIGVTGTKGKGTTVSLIAEILKESGINVHLIGNIGVPALDALSEIGPDDLVVYEMSSFQLWDMDVSPHIAVVLMISPEHMDVHNDMDEYVAAKSNIAAHQTTDDIVVYHPDNKYSVSIANKSLGTKIKYMSAEGAMVVGESILIDGVAVMDVEEVSLIGPHNLENVCAAITAAWQYTADTDAIARGVGGFKGLEHRLELVGEAEGVEYYDDSIGTTPESTVAAIKSFDSPKILILGGSSKGADFSELAELISKNDIRAVITLGVEGSVIAGELVGAGFDEAKLHKDLKNMKDVVSKAAELAKSGDVVILSPACASFDMFDNYQDRGNKFKAAVKDLT